VRPADSALRQRSLSAAFLGALGLLGWLGITTNVHRSIFLVIFSLGVSLTACYLGITAMRHAQRAGSMRPVSSLLGTVFGGIAALISALILIYFVVFWQQLNAFSQCYNSASTVSAQQACRAQLERSTGISTFGSGG
jgi:hypothetical protein